ncbi:MAG: hypothetical protein ABIR79_01450, partial [Candidatus Binatia bacterium]
VLMLGGERAAAAIRRTAGRIGAVTPARYLTVLGVIAALEATAVAYGLFGRMPPLIDAWVQYFQARILLGGTWIAPAPASPAHFGVLFAPITDHGWFGQYPPVHPALLALGMAGGVPWLVTPLLAAALPAVVYALGAGTGDQRVARLAALLVLLSPFVIAIDASAMNHLPTALAVAAGLAALGPVAAGSVRAGAVLGAAVGLTLGLRPLDGVLLAALGSVAVGDGVLHRRGFGAALAVAAAGLVTLAPTLAYNLATTGSATTFTYSVVQGTLLGLDQDVPWGTTLTALRAIGLTAVDGHQLDVYLLEWPIPVTVLAAIGCWRLGRGARVSAGYVMALVGALFFYFHRDTLFGPRLLFSAVPPLLVLIAAGIIGLADLRRPLGSARLVLGDAALVVMLLTAVLVAGTLAPNRLWSHRMIGSAIALHPEEDATRAGIARAVVLVPDGLGSRLIVRLWAAGVPMTQTSALYKRADACRLTEALATTAPGPDFRARLDGALVGATPGKRAQGASPDAMLRLPDDGKVSQRCAAELGRDRRGMLQFAPYLYLNTPTLDGPIIWARELGGEDDAALARRYPDRPVYRYRGPQRDGGERFERLAERGDAWDGSGS